MQTIEKNELLEALATQLGRPVEDARYEAVPLAGGTLGDVRRVEGVAISGGKEVSFRLVAKSQKIWERPGDPESWRREYDLYRAGLDTICLPWIHVPRCYLLREEPKQVHIWMEHVQGKTGAEQLNAPELALVAERLGAFQADFARRGPWDLACLRPFPAVRSSFAHYARILQFYQQPVEGFPEPLRLALLDWADRGPALLDALEALPRTCCQGDVHHDNLSVDEGPDGPRVYLIDWDTAGYGLLGEDVVDVLMEAFVYSERDIGEMPAYAGALWDVYRRGAAAQGAQRLPSDEELKTIAILAWGYRVAGDFWFTEEGPAAKVRYAEILEWVLTGGRA